MIQILIGGYFQKIYFLMNGKYGLNAVGSCQFFVTIIYRDAPWKTVLHKKRCQSCIIDTLLKWNCTKNNPALLWQKEASDKSPKSEKVMFCDWTYRLSIFYVHSEFGAETLTLLKDDIIVLVKEWISSIFQKVHIFTPDICNLTWSV